VTWLRLPGGIPAWLAALAVICAVLGGVAARSRILPLSVGDQQFYIGIAYDIRHHGVFTNGFVFAEGPEDAPHPPGMRFTPLYPALLATVAAIDPGFGRALDCVAASHGQDTSCPRAAPLLRTMQYAMIAWVLWLVWWLARRLSHDMITGWLALGLALAAAPMLAAYANNAMTEIVALTFAVSAIAAGVVGIAGPVSWLALAGLCAGAAALTRPAFLFVWLVAPLAAVMLARARCRPLWLGCLAFWLAGALVMVPWVLRNAVVLGTPGLTAGYGPQVLVQRLAFDQMTWFEWRLAFLCWMPDGNGLGDLLFGHGACHRYGWSDTPDTFYEIGNGALMQSALAASGGWDRMMSYLVHELMLPDLIKYLAVTLPLALRGAFIVHWWGFVLAPICAVATVTAVLRRDASFLVVTLAPWFMLLLSAAVAVNQERYNHLLLVPYAISGAMLLRRCHHPVLARLGWT
jgi:4-amino-4-deoxy-L-arabinose transferase-like glycosyltransferase